MKESKTIKIILFIILAFGVSSLIVSCDGFLSIPAANTSTETPEFYMGFPTYTDIPNEAPAEILPTNTVMSMPISTLLPTPSPVSDDYVKKECLDISSTIPSGVKLEGVIVLKKYPGKFINSEESDAFLYDLTTQNKEIIPKVLEKRTDILVSPDGIKLAQEFDNAKRDRQILTISNSSGAIQKQITLTTGSLYGWVNSQQVILWAYDDTGEIVWIVFNPETEEQVLFPFSELTEYKILDIRDIRAFIDPTLTRVVYPVYFDPNLLNWTERQVLASFSQRNGGAIKADWKLDGSQVAIVANGWINPSGPFEPKDYSKIPDEIYTVDRDGGIVQTTHLGDYYDIDSTPYGLRWSPDGRFIATWLYAKTGDRLVLIDTIDQKVVDFCVPSLFQNLDLPAPIWSPDSKQILVEERYGEGVNHVIIIDIEKKAAIQIAENERPIGWMVATP